MKDISEVFDTIANLNSQFKEVKSRYDKHAGFKMRLQKNYCNFVNLARIYNQKICCESLDIEFSSYPFQHSASFARCIHVKCNGCGTTWVPSLDFDIVKYYENEYAANVQPFRKSANSQKFWNKENTFFQTDTFRRMFDRSIFHLDLLEDQENRSLLELGPGVGILLKNSVSRYKYAYEADRYSKKILQDELNIDCIDIKKKFKVHGIVASHFLEHVFIEDIPIILDICYNSLHHNGVLVIEVPCGADQILSTSEKKSRENIIFEPHLIHFSVFGLVNMLQKSKFSIDIFSKDKALSYYKKAIEGNQIEYSGGIVIKARKPEGRDV